LFNPEIYTLHKYIYIRKCVSYYPTKHNSTQLGDKQHTKKKTKTIVIQLLITRMRNGIKVQHPSACDTFSSTIIILSFFALTKRNCSTSGEIFIIQKFRAMHNIYYLS